MLLPCMDLCDVCVPLFTAVLWTKMNLCDSIVQSSGEGQRFLLNRCAVYLAGKDEYAWDVLLVASTLFYSIIYFFCLSSGSGHSQSSVVRLCAYRCTKSMTPMSIATNTECTEIDLRYNPKQNTIYWNVFFDCSWCCLACNELQKISSNTPLQEGQNKNWNELISRPSIRRCRLAKLLY